MTRALSITRREAEALLRAAEAQKAIIEVKIGDKVIRLIPECHAQDNRPVDVKKKGYL